MLTTIFKCKDVQHALSALIECQDVQNVIAGHVMYVKVNVELLPCFIDKGVKHHVCSGGQGFCFH